MGISHHLCTLAVQQMVAGTCSVLGLQPGYEACEGVARFLTRHFLDHSKKLDQALKSANERAWKALEVALAGDSLWDRCKRLLVSAEDRAFREQVKPFLDACPLAELQGRETYRQACLEELRSARKANVLTGGSLDPASLARDAGAFARFSSPTAMIEAEGQALQEMGGELEQAGFPNLASFIVIRPSRGDPLLVVAARFFFRRAVEEDAALFQGLAFAKLEEIQHGQDAALRSLQSAMTQQGERLERILSAVEETVQATHAVVLDLQTEQERQGEQSQAMYQVILDLQGKLDLLHREVRPSDSLSIRSDTERSLVKRLVGEYRALPEEKRQQLPALLNAIGKLEVAVGNFQEAQHDFGTVAEMVGDPEARAEAHANTFHAALERRDWDTALRELKEAVALDPTRHAPFPFDKYQPQRILGAGGFGIAFLCRHRFLNAEVVVKTLQNEDLDRGINEIFSEAQTLRQLDHPAIIRVQDGGFGSPTGDGKPYLVMDYFPGKTLEDHARETPLELADFLEVARQIAHGLQGAHSRGILHRDVKPANLLVNREGTRWQAKLIDFGLALRRTGKETMLATSSTLTGSSIAGTLEYAAPEQMGKLPGVGTGPSADIYGFARTCCFALFQTPQPLPRHWRRIPEPLADLLESCLEENPEDRPRDFGIILERLQALSQPTPQPARQQPSTRETSPPALPRVAALPAVSLRTEMTVQERLDALAALRARVQECTLCPQLAQSRRNTVFGTGPLDPQICFVGEAPGADEDRTGEPFVGAAGQVLNRILAQLGIRRQDVYICNTLKCRPPSNRKPWATEIRNCNQFLEQQIALIRPRSICALGVPASQTLLQTTQTLGRLRGTIHDYQGIPVICTYHPASLLPGRNPQWEPNVIRDLQMLLRSPRMTR
jgi:uracil-DNA glycosylase family 4